MSEKLKKKDKTLLNLVFKSWFMQASLNYVWQIKKLGGILFNSSHRLRNQYLITVYFWWKNNNE